MATLTNSYQYLGRSSVMTSVSGKLSYYLLLYGKTSADPITGIHSVTILGRLASTSTGATFYQYATSHSGTIVGKTAFSGTGKPSTDWEYINSTGVEIGGVKYKTYTDIGSGSVNVDCTDGLAKDIALTFKWSMPSGDSASYTPPAGTSRTVSVNATLPAIPRASQPSCITFPNNTRDVGYFGDTIKIHMNSKSSGFTHNVYYSFGTKTAQKIAFDVVNNVDWNIPLDLIGELASDAKNGWGQIYVETYTDSGTKYVGSKSCEFSANVPDVEETKPKVTMILDPVGVLPPAFAGLYIQGLTKVKATLSASGEYGASISSYLMKIDNVLHDKDVAYTSSYLEGFGEKKVYGYATDSREHTGETFQTINVLPYSNPRLEDASAVRCDKNGNESESGTYLKISGKRNYSPCVLDGVQKNFCKIQYRYSQDKVNYSEWVTILDYNDLSSDEVTTEPLCNGIISTEASYLVHIQAIDDVGKTADAFVTLQTEKVYMHRDGARNALGLGKYNERDNAVDSNWDFYMNNHTITGLAAPKNDTDAVPKYYVAPKDKELGTRLSAVGWYKIGIITANMCSVITLTIGGMFENNQAIPSMVDIATHYGAATLHLRLASSVENQISRIGVTKESNLQFGVYAYYNSSKSNPVNINAHSHMGEFQKDNWVASSLTDDDFETIINLKS